MGVWACGNYYMGILQFARLYSIIIKQHCFKVLLYLRLQEGEMLTMNNYAIRAVVTAGCLRRRRCTVGSPCAAPLNISKGTLDA